PQCARAALAPGHPSTPKDELLVVLQPQRVDEIGARAVLLLDPACVRDLAAARRIERGLGQLRLEVAVAGVGERGERRAHAYRLVAYKIRPRSAAEPRLVPPAALAGDLLVLLHQARELFLVPAEAPLARPL